MWVFEWFQRWFQQKGHREYVNPRHKHDLSKALLEHILSYGYAGYACPSCIHDFLSSPRNWIFVYWPFILLFLPMKSSPKKQTQPWGPRPATKPRFIAKVQRRLEVIGDEIPIKKLGNSMQFLPQSPFWLKPLKPSLSKETFLPFSHCFLHPPCLSDLCVMIKSIQKHGE